MKLLDVNVLLNASRSEAPDHQRYRAWMDDLLRRKEPFALTDLVICGFVRIITHAGIYKNPHTLAQAVAIVDDLLLRGSCTWLRTGPRHWQIFQQLCQEANAKGNLMTDAWLAAMAVEHQGVVISADRDFARFPSVHWQHPLDP